MSNKGTVNTVLQLERAGSSGIGADVRAMRKSRRLTLSELALRIGRSVGWLSQVERGLSVPAIDDLRRLASEFDVSISFFFANEDAPEPERGYVVRADARRSLGDPAAGLTEELLSPDLGGKFEMVRSVFAPGAELKACQERATEEAGYVVTGTLELWIGARALQLTSGDSFRIAREPFRWRNAGEEEAVVIWVIAPPVY